MPLPATVSSQVPLLQRHWPFCPSKMLLKLVNSLKPTLRQAVGSFVPFLPQDVANPGSERVVETINEDLEDLLALDARQFWLTVRTNASLQACLDSYLQFARYLEYIPYIFNKSWCDIM